MNDLGSDRRTIAFDLYNQLKSDIIRLQITPGETVSEAEIARQYGVSRQPVREAFIHLADDGFLLIRPQRPTIVRPISEDAVLDAHFVRSAIEDAVIRESAKRWNSKASVEIQNIITQQKAASNAADLSAFHAADELFHETIAEQAGFPFAWQVVMKQKAQMDRVRFLSLSTTTSQTIAEHEQIVAALTQNDPQAASEAMKAHLGRIVGFLIQLREEHSTYFRPIGAVDGSAP